MKLLKEVLRNKIITFFAYLMIRILKFGYFTKNFEIDQILIHALFDYNIQDQPLPSEFFKIYLYFIYKI